MRMAFGRFIDNINFDQKQDVKTSLIVHPKTPKTTKLPRKYIPLVINFLESTSVSSVLYGGPGSSNNHFVDSLERFKKDYAVYGKEERACQRQKKLRILEERKNEQVERQSRVKRNQLEYDQVQMEKVNQSRYLCEIGVKKTGFSNGLPMNPITLEYHRNKDGSQQQYMDEEHKLKTMVRAHHIQHASTSGYNPINGSNLPSIAPLIPKNSEARFETKVGEFYQTKKLDPNVDLGLNPKRVLPRHIGEVDHGNSPIKRQSWEDDDNPFQSAYKSQFNSRPHEEMTNSRMQQSQQIQKKIQESKDGGYYRPELHNEPRYVNNQNMNPILQDSVYRSQVSGSKSRASQNQQYQSQNYASQQQYQAHQPQQAQCYDHEPQAQYQQQSPNQQYTYQKSQYRPY